MTPTLSDDDVALWRHWCKAAKRPAVSAALHDLYAQLDAAVADRAPTCWSSGKCCSFDAYGHRLYVTALEIAWMLPSVPLPPTLPPLTGPCVFQVDRLCSVHRLRPLGCRVFFCQQGTQDWQRELYEDFLRRLRDLHESHRLEYRYLEWRSGLRACMETLDGTKKTGPA